MAAESLRDIPSDEDLSDTEDPELLVSQIPIMISFNLFTVSFVSI